MTLISIKDLRLRTIIGVFDWEQKVLQDLVVNLELSCDLPAIDPDCSDLSQTVDYKSLTKKIINYVETGRFYLLEGLGNALLKIALEHDKRIINCVVRLDKPGALRFADSVSVRLEQSR